MIVTMKDVVAEYNKLTGANIKRFATLDIGLKRLASAKKNVEKKNEPFVVEKKEYKMRIRVDGEPMRSVLEAFVKFGLPINKHGKFRLKMKQDGKAIFDHNGKQYLFEPNC